MVNKRFEKEITREKQRTLVLGVVLSSITIIYLFNILWSPLLFMFYSVWIIMNPGRKITSKEMMGLLVFVTPFLLYCMCARLGGSIFGLLIALIWEIIIALIYTRKKKKEKNMRKEVVK